MMRPCVMCSVKKVFFCFFSFRSCVSRLFPDPTARETVMMRSDHPRAIRERGAKKIREARFLRFNLDARDASHRIASYRIAMLCGARARGDSSTRSACVGK